MQVSQAPVSSLHSNEPPLSPVKVNDAEVEATVPLVPPVMVVSGGVVSTVKVRDAGVWSVLPEASLARTEKVCEPSPSPVRSFGEAQAPQAPASSLHSNVAPSSGLVKLKLVEAVVIVPPAGGPTVIEVSGAPVSTVNARVAGVWSVLPVASLARTENVWAPSPRPV